MVNNDPGAQQYEYDWQNPNKKSFEVGRVVSNTFKVLRENPVQFFLLTFIAVGLPILHSLLGCLSCHVLCDCKNDR